MVTTRSRVSKKGQDVANIQPAAVPTLKRKSTASSSSAESSRMPTKIPRTSLESDLLAEAKLPQAPAPTPVSNDASNAKVYQPAPPFTNSSSNSTDHINNGNRDDNNTVVSQPEMLLTAAPSAPPLAPTAPLVGGSDETELDAVKEPAPEAITLMPEVTTILTAPVTDQLIESLVASSTPLAVPPLPAPTAPEVSSVSAIAPLVTNPQDPLSTNRVAGATTAPVLPPIPTDPVFSTLTPATATVTTSTTPLPNSNSNNYVEPPTNGRLSATLVGIDAATASAAHAQAQAEAQQAPVQLQDQTQAGQVVGGVGSNGPEEQKKSVLADKNDQGPAGTTTISTTV